MKKYVCTVCGYIAEGSIPEQCPVCKAPASAFVEKTGNTYVTEHVVGIGKAEGVPQEIVDGLRANFEGECSEVGMYLAMARVAEREGYPEIAEAYKRYAYEEADHASRFAELLGEVVTDSTKKNKGAKYRKEKRDMASSRMQELEDMEMAESKVLKHPSCLPTHWPSRIP